MREAQCTVRSLKPLGNSTRTSVLRTVIRAALCEDAGHPMPQKVRPCGFGKCPQWHATKWSPCETSRCFNWKTAMQRRNVTCRLIEDTENGQRNITLLDQNKCDNTTRPLQRQECYNDACKGVWRVGEWSEVRSSSILKLFNSLPRLYDLFNSFRSDVSLRRHLRDKRESFSKAKCLIHFRILVSMLKCQLCNDTRAYSIFLPLFAQHIREVSRFKP